MSNGETNNAESYIYIQGMLRELKQVAGANRAHMLEYLIEMAYVECSDIIRGERPASPTSISDEAFPTRLSG